VLNRLKEYEVNISSWKGGKTLWIECKYRGEEIGYLQTRRRFLNCQYYDEDTDDWSANVKCYTYQEWQTKCEEKFADYLKTKA